MKKIAVMFLFVLIFFTVPETTSAAATIFYGKAFGGKPEISIYGNSFTGNIETDIISFTYMKGIRVCADYEIGNYVKEISQALSVKMSRINIGYPVLNQKKLLIYLTVGGDIFSQRNFEFEDFIFESKVLTAGFDIAYILTEKLYVDASYRQSYEGLLKNIYYIDVPLDMSSQSLNINYILTDNLGLTLRHRFVSLETKSTTTLSQDVSTTYLGLVFRM